MLAKSRWSRPAREGKQIAGKDRKDEGGIEQRVTRESGECKLRLFVDLSKSPHARNFTEASTSGLSMEKELTNGSGARVLPSSSTSSWLLDKV